MDTDIPTLDRQPNESELVWKTRVTRYITKHAPKERRYYVRGGKPGATGQRWILPTVFVLLGLLFAVFGYLIGVDVRSLNGPNGQQGAFTVIDSQYRSAKNSNDSYYVPVINVRGTTVVPLLSSDRQFQIGEPITLKYTKQGKVVAAFMDKDGTVSNGPSSAGIIMGVLFIAIGLLGAKFYRGAVELKYVEEEFARLTGQPQGADVL